jgi:NTE family protein
MGSLAIAVSANAAPDSSKRPRICLVLKGGGALGFAHVGVLKVLERARIPIDCIAGTSMGSIVGAAYASGNTVAELEQVLSSTDWNELFGEKIARESRDYRLKPGRNRELYGDAKLSLKDGKLQSPTGVIQGQNIRVLFQRLFGDLPSPISFDSLPVPFRAVAADIETGERYAPDRGDLATLVRASMSVPGAFAPVAVDGKLLIDGGIANNLPVEVALEMGADVLIVVDLLCDLAKRDTLTSPFSVAGQMVNLLLKQNSTTSRALVRSQDVVIEPNVSAFTALEFERGVELMAIGETATQSVLGQLQQLSVSADQYERYNSARTAQRSRPKAIAFVRIKGTEHASQERIAQQIRSKAGDPFDRQIIEEDVNRLYQSGYYQSIQYTVVQEGEQQGVEIEIAEKEWLDNFFRFGFSLEDDLDGNDAFRLAIAYRMNSTLTKDGYGEIQFEIGRSPKLALELYQPIGNASPYFINPYLGFSRYGLTVQEDGEQIAEYSRSEYFGTLNFGRKIGTDGEFTVGVTRASGELNRDVGDPLFPEFSYQVGEYAVAINLDLLDRPDFPKEGYAFNARYRNSVDELGASDEFGDLSGAVTVPWTFGRNTVGVRLDYAYTFDKRPVERLFSLGGFGSVSGFNSNSLIASDYMTAQLVGFRQFSEVANPLFDLAFFLGGTIEFTKIQNDSERIGDQDLITSGSLFFGGDTPLFPIYLGVGLADTGDKSVYLNVGRVVRSGVR